MSSTQNLKVVFNLIYSDADSLVNDIRHPDIYDWINQNRYHFDLADSMRADLKYDINDKVVGEFKHELGGLIMTEILALNRKVYSINQHTLSQQVSNKRTSQGVNEEVVKSIKKEVINTRSIDHQLFTLTQSTIALTPMFDNMMLVDQINTIPFGYNPR